MKKSATNLLFGLLAIVAVCSSAGAADWGSIKGRFVADGTPPKPTPLVINKDQFCIDHKPTNDAVVVGKDNALANAVIYLRPALGQKVTIHPDFEAKLKEPAELDNKGCTFVPHITTARVGQKLIVRNSDPSPVSHNTNLTLLAFNPVIPAGDKTELTISKEGPLPTPVQCNIHPWMKGYLLALSHPYAAVSAEDGTFEIKNIPAGTHDFQLWHEAPGYLKNLKFTGGTTDARGRAKLKIAAGQTLDLGDIKVPARVLIAK
jgi:hypothetical protein